MVDSVFKTSKASIGDDSNNNVIIQNSTLNNPFFCFSPSDMINTLGQCKKYDLIQKITIDTINNAKKVHPLYPEFSACLNSELNRLISTPETEDALKKYPKTIKTSVLLYHKKYPYMDKSETPWDYAYRTQTVVELKTTAYKEFLGDIEDPFPVTVFDDSMKTIIHPPEFPPAVSACISSGGASVTISLRRKPCREFGKLTIGTISEEFGFDFTLITYTNSDNKEFKIKKNLNCDLSTQLRREKLFNEMRKTQQFTITVGSEVLLKATIKDKDIKAGIFQAAPYLVRYLENLLKIEEYAGCHFSPSLERFSEEDYKISFMLRSSLENKWYIDRMDFDQGIRFDYDCISEDLFNQSEYDTHNNEICAEARGVYVSLQGVQFNAEKYKIVYNDAKINNLSSIKKNIKKNRKRILITFKPIQGKKYFNKYYMFENIIVSNN